MRSLQARMFLVFAVIATLPLLAMSYLALNETRAALGEEVGRANGDAAEAAAGYVEAYVGTGRVLLEAEARGPVLREAAASEDRASILRALQNMSERTLYNDTRVFEAAYYLNVEGETVGASPPTVIEAAQNAAHQEAYRGARQSGGFARADPPADAAPIVPMAMPVFVNGTIRGVVVADLSLVPLSRALAPFAPGEGQIIFITDGQGRLLVHPDVSLVLGRADLSSLPPVERALGGDLAPREYDDPATGERTLGASAVLPQLGWLVVNSVPTSVAYSGLDRLAALLIVLSGLLAGAILLAGVAIARRIVAPIQELTGAAQALSAGNLAKRIQPHGDDEIAELGRTFNEMAERISESLEGLRRSEARYRGLVESASDFIVTIQPEGDISFASPMTRRVLGDAAAPGHPATDLVHPADRAEFSRAVRSVLDRAEPALWIPLRLAAADGSSRAVLTNLTPIFDGQERPSRVLAVAHDVTEERRQLELREKAFQMARLVSEEGALDALAHRGLLLLLGAVGLTRGAVFLAHGDQLREASATPRSEPWMAELAARARTAGAPTRERRSVGETAVAVPLLEHGEVLGVAVLAGERPVGNGGVDEVLAALAGQLAVGLRRSLFEQRLKEYAAELETRVAERTAELTQKSEEMEQFLYSVSHDLKAPLISIQGYAQGLEEDYATVLQGEGARYLDRIRRNATLMESLILDILELSRIGRTREQIERVDLGKLLGDISGRLLDRVAAAGGRIEVQPDMPTIDAEPRRLAQLFTNLVDNALKYRHPQRPPVVHITGEERADEVIVHVRDNGRGIPARLQDQLFKIFTRVPTPDMEDPGGTGMGLAIAKRIAETQGGRIWVESEEGVGTTFHAALPRRR